jgi:L-threonylcarbamoyladenylate synthase
MDDLRQAVEALERGEVIVVPTDTVYGVAARLDRPKAVDAIFQLKGRPHDKPLPVLGASAEDLRTVALLDERALRLANEFWPGALTIVVPRAQDFRVDLGGAEDESTVGVRVPGGELIRELLSGTGPLAVTSANQSGKPPATSVEEARSSLGETVATYVDGGIGQGQPSTVISLISEPKVLREEAISEDELFEALKA